MFVNDTIKMWCLRIEDHIAEMNWKKFQFLFNFNSLLSDNTPSSKANMCLRNIVFSQAWQYTSSSSER